MKKVLLVDDEVFVRKGLRSLIDWKKCGYEVYAEIDNGEDALELINNTNPDVVITDIRMPVLDGLELIEKVSEQGQTTPKFIVISGFNDFSYAQKAIRYGVHDFILKPIDKDEMEEALIKLLDVLQLEDQKKLQQKQQLVNQMFDELLTGKYVAKNQGLYTKLLRAEKSEKYFYLLIEMNGLRNEEFPVDDNILKSKIQTSLQEVIKTKASIPIYKHQNKKLGMVITSKDLRKDNIQTFMNRLTTDLSSKLEGEFMVYVGTPITKLAFLKESYQSAMHASLYKYTYKENEAIFYEKVKDVLPNYMDLDHSLQISLMEKIEENNQEIIQTVIDTIFKEFKTKIFVPEAVKTSINQCVNSVLKIIKSMDGDERKLKSYEAMSKIQSSTLTLEQLKKYFTAFMLEAAEMISEIRKDHAKGDIHKIKRYIETNFHENISLKGIANTFFMNPVYMGQLFKKTYGVYFKEFLLELRTNEAKKLLRQTNMRVYEIAEKVGFASTDYFVTQFEKMEGMTPTEYRNQILK